MVTRSVDSVTVVSLARMLGTMSLLWGIIVAITWSVTGLLGGPSPGVLELVSTIVGGAVGGLELELT